MIFTNTSSMRVLSASLFALCTFLSCSSGTDGSAGGILKKPSRVDTLGKLGNSSLDESSGIAASWSHPGVWWTHNDSGNDERIFAIDSNGRDLGSVRVSGSSNRDWEALAIGPCAEGSCVYIGEVGDNAARHRELAIWRIPEPAPPGSAAESVSEPATVLRFRYVDGPKDAEAIWVDADTTVWIASKRPQFRADGSRRPTLVYKLPHSTWLLQGLAVAELVDSLPNVPVGLEEQVTDAALSNPSGKEDVESLLAVRTYGHLMVFDVERGSGHPGALKARCDLSGLKEAQGEGIAVMSSGRWMVSSEKQFSALQAVECR